VRTADWQGKDRGAFIPPENVVPDTPEFAFLGGHTRIRAKRLRQVVSHGLMMPAPDGAAIGDDVTAALGVLPYQPPELPFDSAVRGPRLPAVPPPPGYWVKYDIEPWEKYSNSMFTEGEEVLIYEKLHGTNWRGVVDPETNAMHVASRNNWLSYSPDSLYWKVAVEGSPVAEWLRRHPGLAVVGEMHGWIQKGFTYGYPQGTAGLLAFDVYDPKTGVYLSHHEIPDIGDLPWAPLLYRGPLVTDGIRVKFANGKSTLADHAREGFVIRPLVERRHMKFGRTVLKCVGDDYLLSK
jgi:RNA ligase (TIGR02306 family)